VDRYTPERLAYLVGLELEVVLHPSSVLLRGSIQRTAIAHGLIVEGLTGADAYQTSDADAQDVERQIRRVWKKIDQDPQAHVNSPWLLQRMHEIAGEIAELNAPYEDWQIVYRQALQLARALRGDPQLLALNEEAIMTRSEDLRVSDRRDSPDAQALTTPELIGAIASKATLLVRKEVDLLRQESREDLRSEIAAFKGFAVAAVAAIATLNLALVAAVFALSTFVSPLQAALGLAGTALIFTVVAAAIAWRKHVQEPLDRTRATVKEDVQWAKEQMA
jgi:hypothetical protein